MNDDEFYPKFTPPLQGKKAPLQRELEAATAELNDALSERDPGERSYLLSWYAALVANWALQATDGALAKLQAAATRRHNRARRDREIVEAAFKAAMKHDGLRNEHGRRNLPTHVATQMSREKGSKLSADKVGKVLNEHHVRKRIRASVKRGVFKRDRAIVAAVLKAAELDEELRENWKLITESVARRCPEAKGLSEDQVLKILDEYQVRWLIRDAMWRGDFT